MKCFATLATASTCLANERLRSARHCCVECISQFQARSSPPRATPGHLTPVRLHIVGHLTRIETRPIGHLTRRKNAGQRSRLKIICTPCNMSQLLVVFDKIYVDICELQRIKIFGNMPLYKVWNFQKDVRKAGLVSTFEEFVSKGKL